MDYDEGALWNVHWKLGVGQIFSWRISTRPRIIIDIITLRCQAHTVPTTSSPWSPKALSHQQKLHRSYHPPIFLSLPILTMGITHSTARLAAPLSFLIDLTA